MNIPRPDPVPSRGVSDLDRHIETLLRVIHSRNLAWSDLSEVGKQLERPLTDVEGVAWKVRQTMEWMAPAHRLRQTASAEERGDGR